MTGLAPRAAALPACASPRTSAVTFVGRCSIRSARTCDPMNPDAPVRATWMRCFSESRRSNDCLTVADESNLSSARLNCLGTVAAPGTGDHRDEPPLDLLRRLAAGSLVPDRSGGQPVQQTGRAAGAEDQLAVADIRKVRLHHPQNVGTNPIEPGAEPIPARWRIDPWTAPGCASPRDRGRRRPSR